MAKRPAPPCPQSDGSLQVTGVLAGLTVNGQGGWHIHSGFTCADASGVGGHYFEGLPADPWTSAPGDITTYQANAQGSAQIYLSIDGFSLSSTRAVSGRAVVVHQPTAEGAARSGCGVVGNANPPRPSAAGVAPVR